MRRVGWARTGRPRAPSSRRFQARSPGSFSVTARSTRSGARAKPRVSRNSQYWSALQPATPAFSTSTRAKPGGGASGAAEGRGEGLVVRDAEAEGEGVAEHEDAEGAGLLLGPRRRAAEPEGVGADRHLELARRVHRLPVGAVHVAEHAVGLVGIEDATWCCRRPAGRRPCARARAQPELPGEAARAGAAPRARRGCRGGACCDSRAAEDSDAGRLPYTRAPCRPPRARGSTAAPFLGALPRRGGRHRPRRISAERCPSVSSTRGASSTGGSRARPWPGPSASRRSSPSSSCAAARRRAGGAARGLLASLLLLELLVTAVDVLLVSRPGAADAALGGPYREATSSAGTRVFLKRAAPGLAARAAQRGAPPEADARPPHPLSRRLVHRGERPRRRLQLPRGRGRRAERAPRRGRGQALRGHERRRRRLRPRGVPGAAALPAATRATTSTRSCCRCSSRTTSATTCRAPSAGWWPASTSASRARRGCAGCTR